MNESIYKMKRLSLLLIAFLLALISLACAGSQPQENNTYGVFLGLNPEDASSLTRYQTVVIDAQYFTKEEIAAVQAKGTQVYTYLNIGSIETFREGYDAFKRITLSPYDNWPDEYWVDVSQPEWQQFIAGEAKSLIDKGVDGFFLDNADVYYLYPTDAIYAGLDAILQGLGQYGKPVLINGGDVFVARAVLDAEQPNPVITGVNQECVFTNIDFDHRALVQQTEENTNYYREYLDRCKYAGLDVYLLEYAKPNTELKSEIDDYCKQNGFLYYISPSIDLDAK